MVLSRFATDGYIWVYDRTTNEYKHLGIKDTAVISNYYRYLGEDGKYHYDLEKKFSEIEGDASAVIGKIEKSESLSEKEKAQLSFFVALQKNRVPYFSKHTKELSEAALTKLAQMFERPGGNRLEVKVEQSREYEIKLLLEISAEMASYFAHMSWRIIFAPQSSAYITSDNPFVLFSPVENSPYRGVGVITKGAVKAIPLSKSFYLAMFDEGKDVAFYKADRRHCRHINDNVALNCDRFVYSHSEQLLRSVVERVNLKDRIKSKEIYVH